MERVGDKRVRILTTTITEEWTYFCKSSSGCTNAWPDGPCCGQGYWKNIGSEGEEFIPASLYQSKDG